MSTLLEITSEDIANLGDADLRILIGLLCEQDFRQSQLPTNCIRWGGHQNAPDGGFDVVIDSDVNPPPCSPFKTKFVGIQVKKPDMPKSKIEAEMKPNGELREVFHSLASKNATYVIISSTGSTSESALKDREEGMAAVLKDAGYENAITTKFMDRTQISTWVRNYPSIIVWVRDKTSRKLDGWKPYGNWANVKSLKNEPYQIDDNLRINGLNQENNTGCGVVDAIDSIRRIIKKPRKALRLVGLSGVGKTRFVQALFDEKIGDEPINPEMVIYTDLSFQPNPTPLSIIEQMVSEKKPLFVIVDNCDPEYHHQLTKRCVIDNSLVSILTVEYDVRNDTPAETQVISLESADPKLIIEFLKNRYPKLTGTEREIIAEVSDGNFRIAEAIGSTVGGDQDITELRDEQLFRRLFIQRNAVDEKLEKAAWACSLVYSFNGVAIESTSELYCLGRLYDIPILELYGNVQELINRKLVQSRSEWRAVLPHALSNRLAKTALKKLPADIIAKHFIDNKSERMLISFSRRLSYLHESDEAQHIVRSWLSDDGFIGRYGGLFSDFHMKVFENCVPVLPETALSAMERFAENNSNWVIEESSNRKRFASLLLQIAYEPSLFTRAVNLLLPMVISEDAVIYQNSIGRMLQTLFYVSYSGTHATKEQRKAVIDSLIVGDEKQMDLAFALMESTLKVRHFDVIAQTVFSARPRDYGKSPKTNTEIVEWFECFLDAVNDLDFSLPGVLPRVHKLLANQFRDMWSLKGVRSKLDELIRKISTYGVWSSGLASFRLTKKYDFDEDDITGMAQLQSFVDLFTPNDIEGKIKTYVIGKGQRIYGLLDCEEDHDNTRDGYNKIFNFAHDLGKEVGESSIHLFESLIPEIIRSSNFTIGHFASGVAETCANNAELWPKIKSSYYCTPIKEQNTGLISGYICGLAYVAADYQREVLNELISDEVLGTWFPIIQIHSGIDSEAIRRLLLSLDFAIADIQHYIGIAHGQRHLGASNKELIKLLEKISSVSDGTRVAVQILGFRFLSIKDDKVELTDDLINFSVEFLCILLQEFEWSGNNIDDNHMTTIIEVCIKTEKGAEIARNICDVLFPRFNDIPLYVYNGQLSDFMGVIAKIHPKVFLDCLDVHAPTAVLEQNRYSDPDSFQIYTHPLNHISYDEMVEWCREAPDRRFLLLAHYFVCYEQESKDGPFRWKPFVFDMLAESMKIEEILDNLEHALEVWSWSGSRAKTLEKRLPLVDSLIESDNIIVANWAADQRRVLLRRIDLETQREADEKQYFGGFE